MGDCDELVVERNAVWKSRVLPELKNRLEWHAALYGYDPLIREKIWHYLRYSYTKAHIAWFRCVRGVSCVDYDSKAGDTWKKAYADPFYRESWIQEMYTDKMCFMNQDNKFSSLFPAPMNKLHANGLSYSWTPRR